MSREKHVKRLDLNDESIEELRSKYHAAVDKKIDSFFFQEGQLLVSYAKFLLEHIDSLHAPATEDKI